MFCSYVHGAAPFQSCRGNSGCDPPEDVAIRLAQALVVLMSLWHGRQSYLDASLVVMCGSKWMDVVKFQDACEPSSASPCASGLAFPFENEMGRHPCVLLQSAQAVVKVGFIGHVAALQNELKARVSKALELERAQEESERQSCMEQLTSARQLRPGEHQTILARHAFGFPVLALVHSAEPPRRTLGVTSDCHCLRPWSERSKWERSCAGMVRYQLPVEPASGSPFWWRVLRNMSGPSQDHGASHRRLSILTWAERISPIFAHRSLKNVYIGRARQVRWV